MEISYPDFWDRIDQIEAARDRSSPDNLEALNTLFAQLDEQANQHPDPALFCAMGYLLYIHPEKNGWRDERLKWCLSMSLTIAPDFEIPKLYFGHYYYDKGDYQTALQYFTQAQDGPWSTYYSLKIQEMIVSAHLFAFGPEESVEKLRSYVETCLTADENDVFPVQLVKAIVRAVPTSRDSPAKESCLRLLAHLLTATNQEGLFQDELKYLSSQAAK